MLSREILLLNQIIYRLFQFFYSFDPLSCRKQAHASLADVEVNVLCCFVCDVGSEVAADEAVPDRGEHLLELLSYRGGNLHLGVVGSDGLEGDLGGGFGG